ncbi:MAG: sensor domain-containing diguanylate cyclase [Spirochaetes bacterium]|nr:sensor domain-containing diguanylate cyclase [Spirochaetota bacterium]
MNHDPFPIIEDLFSDVNSRSLLVLNGFSIFDLEKKRVILSERCGKAGITAESIFEIQAPVSMHEADKANFMSMVSKLRRAEIDRAKGSFRFVSDKGEVLWLSLAFQSLGKDIRGGPLLIVLHDEDITELQNTQEEVRERLMEIASLKDLLFAINKSLDFDETLSRIIEHLHRIIPFDRATVQVLEGAFLAVIGSYGYSQHLVKDLRFLVRGVDNPSARAVATRRPIICNDVEKDVSGFIQVGDGMIVKSWLGIPLVYEGRSIGLFALDSFKPDFYNDHHIRIASNVAEHIAIAVEHARQHSMVKEEARTDELTGIANRYGLETTGQEIFLRTSKADQPLGVLMLDIDFFKKVNDTKGHSYGDLVLKTITKSIQQNLRTKDYLVRYGGEEFLVLLPETTTREAFIVAERLRGAIPKQDVDGKYNCPTISIGVFSGIPGSQDLLHEFIHRADLALYEAKKAGRDRCRVWNSKPESFDSRPPA